MGNDKKYDLNVPEIVEGYSFDIDGDELLFTKNLKRGVWEGKFRMKEVVIKVNASKVEIDAYNSLPANHKPEVYFSFKRTNKYCIIMEKLFPFVYSPTNVANAFATLRMWHIFKLTHGDISPTNIMLNKNGNVILIDPSTTGFTRFFHTACISKAYNPSEQSYEEDTISLAKVLFFLKNQQKIEEKNREMYNMLVTNRYTYYIEVSLYYTDDYLLRNKEYKDTDNILFYLEFSTIQDRVKIVEETVTELKLSEKKIETIMKAFTCNQYPEMTIINEKIWQTKYKSCEPYLRKLATDDMDEFLLVMFKDYLN